MSYIMILKNNNVIHRSVWKEHKNAKSPKMKLFNICNLYNRRRATQIFEKKNMNIFDNIESEKRGSAYHR